MGIGILVLLGLDVVARWRFSLEILGRHTEANPFLLLAVHYGVILGVMLLLYPFLQGLQIKKGLAAAGIIVLYLVSAFIQIVLVEAAIDGTL